MISYSLIGVLLTLLGVSAAVISGLLLYIIIKCRLAWWWFIYRSKGLPVYDDVRLLGNNFLTLLGAPNISEKSIEAHKRLGKTYGYVAMTRYGCFTIDLDLIKMIVIDEGDVHINRSQTDFPLHELENSLLLVDEDQWRRMRRLYAPVFKSSKFKTPNVLEEVEKSVEKLIDHIEEKLDKQAEAKKLFEADDLMHKISLQLVLSCFYKQYDLVDFNEEPSYWVKMIEDGPESVRTNVVAKIAIFFPALNPIIDWLVWHFHPQGVWRRKLVDFVREQTRFRMEARKEFSEVAKTAAKGGMKLDKDNFSFRDGRRFKRNMMDLPIDYYLDGKITKEELFNSSFMMIGAADLTTKEVMIHALYLLGRNPREQELARQSVMANGEESEYLSWVINETLRLYPPVPAGCSRTIKRDIELANGHILPKGSFVVTNTFAIHRLKEYWGEDVEEFRPERWRDTSKHHPMQFIPFGAGNRMCVGREFALFELKKVFSALLMRYEFEAKHKDDAYVFDSLYMIMILPNSPTFVTIKRLERKVSLLGGCSSTIADKTSTFGNSTFEDVSCFLIAVQHAARLTSCVATGLRRGAFIELSETPLLGLIRELDNDERSTVTLRNKVTDREKTKMIEQLSFDESDEHRLGLTTCLLIYLVAVLAENLVLTGVIKFRSLMMLIVGS
ncbi:cytochrome P450 3A21-like [Olea europaea subsp. europaea]|uniref:Cytochrome P450 3A21-like n=1 Tax=Olea europaea subsp. europaea TaxID=158383 RepID=A0A8S0RBD1_OLEEU|nr:cytochrome P450 3A21-like [Olea europaea subsp. europaea]